MRVINRVQSIRGRFVDCRRQRTHRKGLQKKNCGRLIPINEITSLSGGMKRRKLISVIPLLSFKAPPRRLDQKREHVKNTCLPTKLLSRVTDNCMNTSPRLMRKYARIFFCRHYADIFCLYSNSYRIFKPCEKITFIFNNAAKKTN